MSKLQQLQQMISVPQLNNGWQRSGKEGAKVRRGWREERDMCGRGFVSLEVGLRGFEGYKKILGIWWDGEREMDLQYVDREDTCGGGEGVEKRECEEWRRVKKRSGQVEVA